MILAGDIGGTNTRLALFEGEGLRCVLEKKYPSRDYGNLTEIVQLFLKDSQQKIDRACFGIAGPIEEGVCRATNLPWVIDQRGLSQDFGITRVKLINDLEANAHGIGCLRPDEFFVLNEGTPIKGNQVLISAGTGLGKACIFWDGKKHTPFACEGGHEDFGPGNEEELHLWQYLHEMFGHVSYERVLSGAGLHNIYRFLIYTGREVEAEDVKREMQEKDPAAVITERALQKTSPACMHALYTFISIYGREAGNFALQLLSFGGVYIGGGIAPKIVSAMTAGGFMTGFLSKGRMQTILSKMPVKVILNDKTALLGAAKHANEE